MAQRTYSTQVIVLQKTKLGETDLILTLLAEDGSQIRVVAKGARKPKSPFASRLELYSCAKVLCASGRSLDIVKEAQIIESNAAVRNDLEHAAAAAPMAELLNKVTQNGLTAPQVFPLTQVCLKALGGVESSFAPAITAAHLLKTVSFSGFRPSLSRCAACAAPLALSASDPLRVSYREGGVICDACAPHVDTVSVARETCRWAGALLHATIDEVVELRVDPATSLLVLRFCHCWIKEHIGSNLKSLDFLLTCDLFKALR
ncbi:MAG: DNA repair protein RecO [Raoultibacter sp.]